MSDWNWMERPAVMSTPEIEEELAVLTDGRPLSPPMYQRIGQLELELRVREHEYPETFSKETASE